MIDFHTHILPNIDDGATDVMMSAEMLQMEFSQGVTTVVATPHYSFDRISVDEFLTRRKDSYNNIIKHINENSIDSPKIILGAEVKLSPHISKREGLEKLCIGDTNVILVEMPYSSWGEGWVFDEIFSILVSRKLTPVIAHLDRYICKRKDYEKVKKLFRMNLNVQVDLDRYPERRSKKVIDKLIKENHVQIVGTDCHDVSSRSPKLKEKLELIRKKHGTKITDVFMENALKLVNTQK